jgi:heparinase II/III-like protein
MSIRTLAGRARRGLAKGPRYVYRRLAESVLRRARRPWSRAYPFILTPDRVVRSCGARSVDHLWQQQLEAPFFLHAGDRDEWVREFTSRYPDTVASRIAAAEAVLRHEFDLLGSGPTVLGSPLPWHDDFKQHRRWPLSYSPDIEYLELDQPTDVKVPWELSRCQHFTALGQAYWLTGDERFADEFVAEVTNWVATNPWGFGVNWACAMDVALRACSWIWGFHFMGASRACAQPKFRRLFLKSLYLHGEHVATHLERGDVNGNHFLSDGVGLVFLGVFFRATPKGKQWLELGRSIVVDEIFAQTTDDGVDFEQSTSYHRLVLELFLTAYVLLDRAGASPPAEAWTRLERMLEFVAAYSKPDGLAPLIGDADDGRVQKLGSQRRNDHRYLMAAGAALFRRGEFKRGAGCFWDEAFWLLGPDGASRYDRVAEPSSAPSSSAFPHGGFYVLRSPHAHLIVDCGEVGMRGRGGHGHNDILSFELWMNGANLITDCGAYTYTASRDWRNQFRSTAFHNTIQVEGEELNRFVSPDALWQLHDDARPVDVAWRTGDRDTNGDEVDVFRGGHTGYLRLRPPVRVIREIQMSRCHASVTIRDAVEGYGRRRVTWRFHLDPDVRATVEDDATVALSHPMAEASIRPSIGRHALSIRLRDGWVSPSYGVKVPTKVVEIDGEVELPMSVEFMISSTTESGRRHRVD